LSSYSSEIELLAAFKPAQPIPPVTHIVEDKIVVDWTAPSDNGSPITSYRVTFKKADGEYSELAACDGSLAATFSARQCTVFIYSLSDSPFLLTLGDNVYAKVVAINFYGESVESDAGNGATILLVPSAPVGLADNTGVTDASKIGITWRNGISTGGSPILDYRISYDQASGSYVVLQSGVTTKSYTTSVLLTPGQTYKFKVEARNQVGYSQLSQSVSILCAQPPDQPGAPTVVA
jgi:hypothetical protein